MVSRTGLVVEPIAPGVDRRATDRSAMGPIDMLVAVYVAVVSVIAVLRMDSVTALPWILGAHSLVLLLIVLVRRPNLGAVGRALRELYPLFLLLAFYSEIDLLNGAGARAVHDATIQAWEQALFGGQPSRDWWQASPSVFWSTLLHAAYLSYYAIVAAPALYFAWRGDFRSLRQSVFVVMATFFACYLCFLLFPVEGPYYAFARPTGAFIDNPAARIVYRTLANGSAYGAAFPSSHVAGAVAATLTAAWRAPRLAAVLAIPTALLTAAVVYCQMHYAIDAIAGLAVGAGVAITALRWSR